MADSTIVNVVIEAKPDDKSVAKRIAAEVRAALRGNGLATIVNVVVRIKGEAKE